MEISTMIKYMLRKWIVGQLNKLLEQYKDNILKVRNTLTHWITKLELVVMALKRVLTRIEDNKMDDTEIDDTVADIEKIIKEWWE